MEILTGPMSFTRVHIRWKLFFISDVVYRRYFLKPAINIARENNYYGIQFLICITQDQDELLFPVKVFEE